MTTWVESNQLLTLNEYREHQIDGMSFNDDNDFEISKDWVFERYSLFNKKYFGSKLPPLKKVIFTYESYYRGQAGFEYSTKTESYEFVDLRLSQYRNYTEVQYCETLLHEMIHIYLYTTKSTEELIKSPEHDKDFFNEMRRLGEYGWSIPLFTVAMDYLSKKALYRISRSILAIIPSIQVPGKYEVFLTAEKNKRDILEHYGNARFVKVSNPKDFSSLTYVDDFAYNIVRGISTDIISRKELDALLAKIKEVRYVENKSFIETYQACHEDSIVERLSNDTYKIWVN